MPATSRHSSRATGGLSSKPGSSLFRQQLLLCRPGSAGIPDRAAHAFLLRRKIDRAAIGAIGFGGRGPILELGYALGRDFWGQGYATEATVAMINTARTLGLGGLQAYSFVENPASARVLEKAGFSKVGTIIREYPKRGGMRRVTHFRTML